jgi:hypothetical protein
VWGFGKGARRIPPLCRIRYYARFFTVTIAGSGKVFDFCGFRLRYDKIILAKSCLANFEKRLSKLYEQLSKCKSSSYKNTFTTTELLKKIELYVWRFGRWARFVRQTVIKNCGVISLSYDIKQTISANPPIHKLPHPKNLLAHTTTK